MGYPFLSQSESDSKMKRGREARKRKRASREYKVSDFADSRLRTKFDEEQHPLFAKANELKAMSIIVLPVDPKRHARDAAAYDHHLANVPEFKNGYTVRGDYNAGSFGGNNLPSFYHNPSYKQCSRTIYDTCHSVLCALASTTGMANVEGIPDRQLYRTHSPPSESLHRDQSAGLDPTDLCFGTMYNLNRDVDQHFSCLPTTHELHSSGDKGFTSIKDKASIKDFNARKVSVRIPPGHVALFFENMKHEVKSGKPSKPLKRQGMGFRLTDSDTQWWPSNIERFKTQAALAHKGGEIAPMYPKLWWTNWGNKFPGFVERFVPEMLTTRTYASGKHKGETLVVPKLIPPSLKELGMLYEPWSESDLAMFRPQPLM